MSVVGRNEHILRGLGGSNKDIDGIRRLTKPFVGLTDGKRTFSNVTICELKLCKLDFRTEVMQLKRPRGVLYFGHSIATVMYCSDGLCRAIKYHRRGLACVAYPCEKAMQRHEFWDRRGVTNSYVFFCIHTLQTENR